MEKDELLQTPKHISDSYFQKKDYISAGMINRAMDVVNDYDGVLPQADVSGSFPLAEHCEHRQHDHCDCIGLYCKAEQ